MQTLRLSLKQVAVCVVEPWGNPTEYFPKFLSKQKDVFRKIKKTERYHSLAKAREDSVFLVYVSFCVFVAQDFEMLQLPFQSSRL